jgi:hypothetical protein
MMTLTNFAHSWKNIPAMAFFVFGLVWPVQNEVDMPMHA